MLYDELYQQFVEDPVRAILRARKAAFALTHGDASPAALERDIRRARYERRPADAFVRMNDDAVEAVLASIGLAAHAPTGATIEIDFHELLTSVFESNGSPRFDARLVERAETLLCQYLYGDRP